MLVRYYKWEPPITETLVFNITSSSSSLTTDQPIPAHYLTASPHTFLLSKPYTCNISERQEYFTQPRSCRSSKSHDRVLHAPQWSRQSHQYRLRVSKLFFPHISSACKLPNTTTIHVFATCNPRGQHAVPSRPYLGLDSSQQTTVHCCLETLSGQWRCSCSICLSTKHQPDWSRRRHAPPNVWRSVISA